MSRTRLLHLTKVLKEDFPLEHYDNRMSLTYFSTFGATVEDDLVGTATLIIHLVLSGARAEEACHPVFELIFRCT